MFMLTLVHSVLNVFLLCWLVMWPFSASVYGYESVARQSIYFVSYLFLTDVLRSSFIKMPAVIRFLLDVIVEILVLGIIFLQPYLLMPSFFVTSYALLLKYLLEPLLLLVEANELVKFVRFSGNWLSACIYDTRSDNGWLFKFMVLSLTVMSYIGGFNVIRTALVSTIHPFFTHATAILFLMHLALFIMTICKDEGIISDAGLVFLVSSCCVLAAVSLCLPVPIDREVWLSRPGRDPSHFDLYSQIFTLPEATTVYANNALVWVKRHFGLWFWLIFLVRLGLTMKYMFTDAEDEDPSQEFTVLDLDDSASYVGKMFKSLPKQSSISPNTLWKIVTVIIYAELILQNDSLEIVTSSDHLPGFGLAPFYRLCQSFVVGVLYFKSLSTSSNYEDD